MEKTKNCGLHWEARLALLRKGSVPFRKSSFSFQLHALGFLPSFPTSFSISICRFAVECLAQEWASDCFVVGPPTTQLLIPSSLSSMAHSVKVWVGTWT